MGVERASHLQEEGQVRRLQAGAQAANGDRPAGTMFSGPSHKIFQPKSSSLGVG